MNLDTKKKRPDEKQPRLTYEDFGDDSWVSLVDALLKPGVSVGALATFIDKEGVKVFDRHGNLINATDGDEKESTSKARALNLLARYYEELRDCADLPPRAHPPQDPDRWLDGESPLREFGWPKDELPDDPDDFAKWIIGSLLPKSKKLSSSSQNKDSDYWKEQARQIADECYDSDTRSGSRDSLRGYASRVMDKMRERDIYAPHGPIDNPNTVMRDALQADKWWRKKKPITYGKRGMSGKLIK